MRASSTEADATFEGPATRVAERVQAGELASSVAGAETVTNETRVGSASGLASRPHGGV